MRKFFVSIGLLLVACPLGAGELQRETAPVERLLQHFGTNHTGFEVERFLTGAQSQAAALFFEQWLMQSRNAAASAGTSSIPPYIRQQLQGFYQEALLDRVRFTTAELGALNLANLSIHYGDAAAVTLIDVIVFKKATDAYNNTTLWAHELKHVQQFHEWGVAGFVRRYLEDWNGVEDEAHAAESVYQKWQAQMAPLLSRPRSQP